MIAVGLLVVTIGLLTRDELVAEETFGEPAGQRLGGKDVGPGWSTA